MNSSPATRTSRRRQQIVAQAAVLFEANGYASTSMEMLAEAVGVAKPTVYHYFRSKGEILAEIHDEFIDLLLTAHEARPQTDPKSELLALMTDMVKLMQTHHGHVRVFFEHHRDLEESKRSEVFEKRARFEQVVQDTLQRGIEDGTFRQLKTRLTALAIFGMCNWAYQWYRPDGPMSAEDVGHYFWTLICGGIAAD